MESDSTTLEQTPERGPIRDSWLRSRAAGLEPGSVQLRRVSDAELRRRRLDAVEWLALAREHVNWTSAALTDLPHAFCIADPDGILLHATGMDPETQREFGLEPGFDWSESTMGTNGVGTALASRVPVIVAGNEHYAVAARSYTCTAAPLHDPAGNVVGALNLTTIAPAGAPGRFALVLYMARAIERELAGVMHLRGALASSAAETERAQRQVAEREEQFRALADSIPHLAWMTDAEGWIYWYNRAWYEYTGQTPEEAQGWGWRAVHDPERLTDITERFQESLRSGEPWEDTFRLRGVDGQYRWFISRALPIRDASGSIVRWFGTNTDINTQVETELALRNAQQDLLRLYEQAQGAVQERDDAVAIVSHDLRAPLNVLTMASHMLLDAPGEQKQTQAETISRMVAQMTRLVSDLLDMTRARAGRLPIDSVPLRPEALVRSAVRDAAPIAAGKHVEIRTELPLVGMPNVAADYDRIMQVFSNLIGNAIEHTPAGGHVVVRVQHGGDVARFEVSDTGSGIPEDELPHVFERFWRGRGSNRSGTGLGLSICKAIVEAHGGYISAASTLGRGATFSFTLPVASA